jgi:hypothetical protein
MLPYQVAEMKAGAARLQAQADRQRWANQRQADMEAAQAVEPAAVSAPPADDQLSRADLTSMSPADIVKAKREGRLNACLGRTA